MQLTEKIYNTLFEEILKGKYSLGEKFRQSLKLLKDSMPAVLQCAGLMRSWNRTASSSGGNGIRKVKCVQTVIRQKFLQEFILQNTCEEAASGAARLAANLLQEQI